MDINRLGAVLPQRVMENLIQSNLLQSSFLGYSNFGQNLRNNHDMFSSSLVEQFLYSLPEYRLDFQKRNFIEVYSYNGLLATRKIIEFDGNTVLCRVCGDKASGFHYGVHACEGCKGFFRRSIQQKIQYRPCLKNQMCNIMRVNRNRCQYCRLRKCIAVGMSRDAVRFGRVPKREKAKIMEQMQKVNAQMQGNQLNEVLDDSDGVIQHIVSAHMQSCEFTRSKFISLFEKAWEQPNFVDCPAHMACPLNPSPDQCENIQKWDEFSSCFTPAIRSVVNFAKSIPGFSVFSQEDQVTLLKAGTFEVLLVHLACLFDSRTSTMMFTNGKLYRKLPQQGTTSAGFLLDSMFDFADRVNQLRLTDEELALFSAMVIVAQDRPGLRYQDQIQRVHTLISQGLQALMKTNHPSEPAAFSKLLMKIPDLRTLNTLHSEKLLGLTVPQTGNGSCQKSEAPISSPPLVAPGQSMPQPAVDNCPRKTLPTFNGMGPALAQPPFPSPFPPGPMLRCPVSRPEALARHANMANPAESHHAPGQTIESHRAPGQPIVPHHVTPDSQEKELILQTPIGSFHRCAPAYQGIPSLAKSEGSVAASHQDLPPGGGLLSVAPGENFPNHGFVNHGHDQNVHHRHSDQGLHNPRHDDHRKDARASQDRTNTKIPGCSSPEDFIDVDLYLPSKMTNQKVDMRFVTGKNGSVNKTDMRRVMTDPMVPEMFRKRLLESMEYDIDPKIARLWDYDMRSSRSNSLSSSSSMESSDSAYKTISNPATPRSSYELARSPYASPGEVPIRHPLHQSTPVAIPKVTDPAPEVTRGQSPQEPRTHTPESSEHFLPTLRNMLIAGRMDLMEKPEGSSSKDHEQRQNETCSQSPVSDDHYWMHKKLKLNKYLTERGSPDQSKEAPIRERAASFSTAVSQLRRNMAPPILKPISREAPPRLLTRPSEGGPTFGSLMGKVMEAALRSEQDKLHDINAAERRESKSVPLEKLCESVRCPISNSDILRSPQNPAMQGSLPRTLTQTEEPLGQSRSIEENIHAQCSDARMESPPSLSPSNSQSKTRQTANAAQRHPELLSRLNSAPQVVKHAYVGKDVGGSLDKVRRSSPPSLVPVQDQPMSGAGSGDKYSPPPLLPMQYVAVAAQQVDLTARCADSLADSHQSALSTLKDKILKRIDSQENLSRMSPSQPWNSTQHTVPHTGPTSNPRKRRPPPDADLPPLGLTKPPPPLPLPLGHLPGTGGLPVHPALMYNAVQQYQALQHLHMQAAQIQRHMMGHGTPPALPQPGPGGQHILHMNPSGLSGQELQPMNLTKQQQDLPPSLSMTTIKHEPL